MSVAIAGDQTAPESWNHQKQPDSITDAAMSVTAKVARWM
jgi:hypothetical protein